MEQAVPEPRGGDAALVATALAGDRAAFAAIYDRYADRLHDFCWSLLRDRDDAADATQDTFVIAAQRLRQLRDPDRLRPWLYAIARSQALRRIRTRRRFDRRAEVTELVDSAGGPERAAEQADLRALVWAAAGGLAERDRALLDLHVRQGLDGAELGEAMGVSAAHAAVLLHRLRAQVERSLGALLVARLGSDDCTELGELLAGWDGGFSPLLRKRVARHVDGCEVCAARRARVASPLALLSAVPLFPAPAALREKVLDKVGARGPGSGPGSGVSDRTRVAAGVVAVAAAVAAISMFALLPSPSTQAVRLVQPVAGDASPLPVAADGAGPGTDAAATDGDASPAASGSGPPATPTAAASPGPSSAPVPTGVLTLSSVAIDLGSDRDNWTLSLANDGQAALEWTTGAPPDWLDVAPGSGRLDPGEQVDASVSVDRSALSEGPAGTVLAISSDGGDADVAVSLVVERAPVIQTPVVSPASVGSAGCPVDTALVSAVIADEAGVASATVSASLGSGNPIPLILRSGAWYGRVGPFSARGTVSLVVSAIDTRGNQAASPPVQLELTACPRPSPTPSRLAPPAASPSR